MFPLRVAVLVSVVALFSVTLHTGCSSTPDDPEADSASAEADMDGAPADVSADAGAADTTAEAEMEAEAKPKPALLDFPLKHNMGRADGTFIEDKQWAQTDFYGEGAVRIDGDTAFLLEGNDMTGITWQGRMVRMNYEITLEAKRVEGHDFFCGLTFLYGDDPVSFIVGGWGGTCVGISSIDYQDAYNNETATFQTFDLDTWYRIRVRVTPGKIEAWIDDEQVVDVDTEGREIGIRLEVDKARPLGISTWRTTGAVRNITLNSLDGAAPEAIDVSTW